MRYILSNHPHISDVNPDVPAACQFTEFQAKTSIRLVGILLATACGGLSYGTMQSNTSRDHEIVYSEPYTIESNLELDSCAGGDSDSEEAAGGDLLGIGYTSDGGGSDEDKAPAAAGVGSLYPIPYIINKAEVAGYDMRVAEFWHDLARFIIFV